MTDALHSSSSYESDKHSAPVVQSQTAPVVEDKELARLRRKERLSSAFTIACAGFALVSDGLQNNIMVRHAETRLCRYWPSRLTLLLLRRLYGFFRSSCFHSASFSHHNVVLRLNTRGVSL